MSAKPSLKVSGLTVQFGGLTAVSDVSLDVPHGSLVGLIGPNGAGKTTIFNALTGLCKVSAGSIQYGGTDFTNKPTHVVAKSGISRTFQNIRLFKALSVQDNLRIAFHKNCKYSILAGIARSNSYHGEERKVLETTDEILDLFNLADHKNEISENLSYGNQRKLEIARALATDPTLLLLDEPAAGMNPFETRELMNLIEMIHKNFNLTVFLIEHDMSLVMKLCAHIFVVDYGKKIAEGNADDIRSNPRVIEAYLGEDS